MDVQAQGKEVTDAKGVQKIEIDKLVTKIRVENGNIELKAPPNHSAAGKSIFLSLLVRILLQFRDLSFLKSSTTIVRLLEGIAFPSNYGPILYVLALHRISSFPAEAAATFFNSNPRLVLDIASPIIEDTAATVSRALVARALSVLTKQELLP